MISKRIIIGGIVFISFISVFLFGYAYFSSKTKRQTQAFEVTSSFLSRHIEVFGSVQPQRQIHLAFEQTGQVQQVRVDIGQYVKQGQILATLKNNDIQAKMTQAQANVESQIARLAQLQAALDREHIILRELEQGTRQEEIMVQKSRIDSIKQSIFDAKKQFVNATKKAYTVADHILYTKVSQFMSGGFHIPKLTFTILNEQLKNDIEWRTLMWEADLKAWKEMAQNANEQSDIHQIYEETYTQLRALKTYVELILQGLTNFSDTSQPDSPVISYRMDMINARFDIEQEISAMTLAFEKVNQKSQELIVEEKQLALKEAGTVQEQIQSQQAVIRQRQADIQVQDAIIQQAKAGIQLLEADLSKTILYAPISGTIVSVDIEIGEIVSSQKSALSLISDQGLELVAHISELDIAQIHQNDKARVSIDAFFPRVFQATVYKIDPIQTLINNVPTYKVTFFFDDMSDQIKSGMSASISIQAQSLDNVLSIPVSFLSKENDAFFVYKQENGKMTPQNVEVGIIGSNGFIHVLSGLEEGDIIYRF